MQVSPQPVLQKAAPPAFVEGPVKAPLSFAQPPSAPVEIREDEQTSPPPAPVLNPPANEPIQEPEYPTPLEPDECAACSPVSIVAYKDKVKNNG